MLGCTKLFLVCIVRSVAALHRSWRKRHWTVAHGTWVLRKYESMHMFTSVPTERRNSPFKTHLQNCFRGWSMGNPRISKGGMARILEMYALDERLKALQETGGMKLESNKLQRK